MASNIQLRRGTAAEWTATNPILADGEIGLETDTLSFKLGDGVTNWSTLSYGGVAGPANTDVTIDGMHPFFLYGAY